MLKLEKKYDNQFRKQIDHINEVPILQDKKFLNPVEVIEKYKVFDINSKSLDHKPIEDIKNELNVKR